MDQLGFQLSHGLLILLIVGGNAVPAALVFHEGNALALDTLGDYCGGLTFKLYSRIESASISSKLSAYISRTFQPKALNFSAIG